MAESSPTTADLLKAKAITSEQVEAAAQALLADPQTGSFPIADGYTLDLAAAVRAHQPSAAALPDPDRKEKFKLTMARTAILQARPEKA